MEGRRREEGRTMLKDRRALQRLDTELVEWIVASATLWLWPAEEWPQPPYGYGQQRSGHHTS
eukprot:92086-Hanusia_phi.AAC.1